MLSFEQAFSVRDEPAVLHYKASFAGHNETHSVEVWRDGQSRIRRRTDNNIDTYVLRDAASPGEYQMLVADYQRRITTQIDRNNLIRLGHFSDWFDLAHGLRHPAGPYQLRTGEAPVGAPAPIGKCRWYELQQEDASHRICWSAGDGLPLMVWSPQRGVVWQVTEIDHRPISADIFQLHDTGFVRVDANADIDSD